MTEWYDEVDFNPEPDEVVQKGDASKNDALMIQRLLKGVGYDIAVDGVFGSGTERAVRQFQKSVNLVADGRVGPKTLLMLEQTPADPRFLTQADLEDAAHSLGVPVAAVMAVNEVESRGSGFFNTGDPVILYERHIMRRRLKKAGIDPTPWIRQCPDIVNTRTGGYVGGVAEYRRLAKARDIHEDSALESCSWGAFQIMGFHWKRLGYKSVTAMVAAMQASEGNQLKAFVSFIKADSVLWNALKDQNWAGFARRYNGKGYAKNAYDVKMAKAFDRHSRALA